MGYILNLETKHGSYCLSCLYWSNTNTGVDVDLPTSTDGCSKALVKHGKGGHLLFWYVRGFFFRQRIFQVLQINIFGYQLILCPLKKKKKKKEFHIELAVLLKGLIQHFCSVSQTSTASENCVAVQKKSGLLFAIQGLVYTVLIAGTGGYDMIALLVCYFQHLTMNCCFVLVKHMHTKMEYINFN